MTTETTQAIPERAIVLPGFIFNQHDSVRCRVTGFSGVVHSRSEWANGCRRYGIQSPNLKDGKPLDPVSFDEQELDLVEGVSAEASQKNPPGGPQDDEKSPVREISSGF